MALLERKYIIKNVHSVFGIAFFIAMRILTMGYIDPMSFWGVRCYRAKSIKADDVGIKIREEQAEE